LAPPILNSVEGRSDGTISRELADRVDIQIDGLGGFVSNGVKEVLALGPGEAYRSRLLLRGDLDKVIDKSQQSWAEAAKDALRNAGQGARALVTSPIPVVVVGTISVFIEGLFSSNKSIDVTSTRAHEEAANITIPPDRMHYETAVAKRAQSTAMMGMMSAAIPGIVVPATASIVGPAVAGAIDAVTSYLADKLSTRLSQGSAAAPDRRSSRHEEPEFVVLSEGGLRATRL
jgi:hypothetical protein